MKIKPGVRVGGIKPEMVLALRVAEPIFNMHSSELVVTSVIESTHSLGSLHYVGYAVDIRLPKVGVDKCIEELRESLGADFDVMLENDHIHIEFQPKVPVNK